MRRGGIKDRLLRGDRSPAEDIFGEHAEHRRHWQRPLAIRIRTVLTLVDAENNGAIAIHAWRDVRYDGEGRRRERAPIVILNGRCVGILGEAQAVELARGKASMKAADEQR